MSSPLILLVLKHTLESLQRSKTYPETEALFGTLDIPTLAKLARHFALLASEQPKYTNILIPLFLKRIYHCFTATPKQFL